MTYIKTKPVYYCMTNICRLYIEIKWVQMFKDIDIKYVDKEITPFGGLSLFFKMLE